jgi:catechol 2,3-dioxygenase-like lactoylglutathione lyase family enzyme
VALHGLAEITLGVTDVAAASGFYREFGLTETAPGRFATADGGEQLRVVATAYRRLVEFTVAADDADDVARIRRAAEAHDLEVADRDGGGISVREPVVGITASVAVRPRIVQADYVPPPTNNPGHVARDGERAPAIFATGPARPRRLGHALYTTTDLDASIRFLTGVLGFRMSDSTPGLIAFLRCSTDHHNIGLIQAPVPFFHHSSWQVDDVDAIGQGAHHLLTADASRSVWGLGRHFLGSNYFWYFRDPAGHYAEYFADLDQIGDDDAWIAREWDPSKSLYAWGPPVPPDFVQPRDVEEIAAAIKEHA